MSDELNTPQGTEDVQPAQADTRPDWDYFDPDEDTEEPHAEGVIEDDGQSVDEDPETEEAEAETAEEDEQETATAADLIELPDGSKVEREEVVKGYLRQSDYTRKTSEVAEQRKKLEAETTRINGITEAFIDHLSRMIPPAPDQALAYSDPNAYTRRKAAHDAAVAQVQEIVKVGEQVKQTQDALSQADRQRLVAEENAKLVQRFPQVSNQKGRQEFFAQAAETAQSLGFSMEELQGATDHRLFALAHYASMGMKAEQARGKAKAKAAKAPPVTNKPSNPTRQAAARNREAMKRLAQTGSIRDALRVDFE